MSLLKRTGRVRLVRRMAGFLAARLAELPLESVRDPRKRKSKWSMRKLLTATLAGIATGAKGLGEVEELLEMLGDGSRRLLKLPSRIPDTTLRDVLVRLEVDDMRMLNHAAMALAVRRKQIRHNLPLRVVSMDGKHIATWLFDKPDAPVKYGQKQQGRAILRTITSCLASADGNPCLDAFPVPPETNEVGAFRSAASALLERWGGQVDVLMYDAGGCSLDNASWVRTKGLDYVFVLAENQRELMMEARRCLVEAAIAPVGTETRTEGNAVVTRRLFQHELPVGTGADGYLDWTHLRTIVRVETTREDKSSRASSVENHFYLSSIEASRLRPDKWLEMLRRRWAVENENHNTWDRIFREDDRPFILEPRGLLVVAILRRIAFNILALFRSVTLRAESSRATPWKTLLRAIHLALTVATSAMLDGVRSRAATTV